MRKSFWIVFTFVFVVTFTFIITRDTSVDDKVNYDGKPLSIAVIGTEPVLINDKVSFEKIELNSLLEQEGEIMKDFDAIMITPEEFLNASNDKFINFYKNSTIPILFFDSKNGHWGFTTEGINYNSSRYDSLKDDSHSTLYLSDLKNNREDYWKFYLEGEPKNLNSIYKEIFKTIETISIKNTSEL